MRGLVFAAFVIASAAAYACDSFDESDPGPSVDAGDERTNADSDGGAGVDAAADQNAACPAEPEWVTPDAGQAMVTCNGEAVSLLNNPNHCGRCNHSCGAESCVAGTCTERKDDDGAAVLGAVHDGAVYYAKRPGGSLSPQGHELKRFAPATGSVIVASFGADAGDNGGETKIFSGAASGDDFYIRTANALFRARTSMPSPTVPSRVATLTSESGSSIAADGDRVFVTMPFSGRIDQVTVGDGGVTPFIASAPQAGESRFEAGKYLWIKQPFALLQGTASSVYMRVGNVDATLLESQDKIGGLAIDGNDLYVMRAAPSGAIIRIDLTSLATEQFFQGELDNSIFSIALAVDATHVYWLKGTGGDGATTEIWKRARCGGAAVRIGRHPNAYRVLALEDRLFIGAEDGLYSIAK